MREPINWRDLLARYRNDGSCEARLVAALEALSILTAREKVRLHEERDAPTDEELAALQPREDK